MHQVSDGVVISLLHYPMSYTLIKSNCDNKLLAITFFIDVMLKTALIITFYSTNLNFDICGPTFN